SKTPMSSPARTPTGCPASPASASQAALRLPRSISRLSATESTPWSPDLTAYADFLGLGQESTELGFKHLVAQVLAPELEIMGGVRSAPVRVGEHRQHLLDHLVGDRAL